MSARCVDCSLPIFGEDGQCHGEEVNGVWRCHDCTATLARIERTKSRIKELLLEIADGGEWTKEHSERLLERLMEAVKNDQEAA